MCNVTSRGGIYEEQFSWNFCAVQSGILECYIYYLDEISRFKIVKETEKKKIGGLY